MKACCIVLLVGCLTSALAVEAASPAEAILEDFAAANRARAEQAHDEAAWRGERERLLAIIAAARADSERLAQKVTAAERELTAKRTEIAELQQQTEANAVRQVLASACTRIAAHLAELTARGALAIDVPTASGNAEAFTTLATAVDAAERAAKEISLAVVVGELEGSRTAAKVLRVSGALAWWVSLDGRQAGTVSVVSGITHLTRVDDTRFSEAIHSAVAMVEGRRPQGQVALPVPSVGAP
jgi:hypothetical protein